MTRRILLADDSVTIQKVIELTFMDDDYEVTAVSNGDEAVASLSSGRPDVVIADVHMPGANGYEVCRRAKALYPQVPVLLLVGTFEPFDEAQSRAAGADAFLKKPFDSQELLHLVERLLAAAPTAEVPVPAAAPAPAAPAAFAGSAAAPFPAGPALSPVEPFPEPPPLAPPPAATEEPFAALEEEPAWSNFELEPEPAAPGLGTAESWEPAAAAAGPSRAVEQVYEQVYEQVFDLEEPGEALRLDDSLLAEVPPLSEAEAEAIAVEETREPQEWREGRAAAPDLAAGAGFGAGLAATPEERAGVPLGAAPLASGLGEVEQAVAEHAEAPAFEAPALAAPRPASAPAPAGASAAAGRLSDEDVDRIARRLVELVGERVVRDVAWEVVPDMAELLIKDRLRELESQVD